MVSLRSADARRLLDWIRTCSLAQLLRSFHVLVLDGPLDASRASPDAEAVVDRVETIRGAGPARVVEVEARARRSVGSMNASTEMRMPLLDVAFYLLDSDYSPQDFTLIFHLRNPPPVDRLQAGATSAMHRFPKSGSRIERNKWVWREDTQFKLSDSPIENFIDEPFDLRQERPVRQALISDG